MGEQNGGNMSASKQVDYLILGNSAAGVAAAEKIRAYDRQGSIMMVSPEPYAAYGRPLISYLVEGKTDEDRIGYKPADFYEANVIETRFGKGGEAVKLDAVAHQVAFEDGSVVGYGKVLAAMGSIPFIPPIEGLADRTNVYPFITLDHAKSAWKAAVAATEKAHAEGRTSRAIVIGGGLIGLKAAEALHAHVDEVVVLEMAPRILPAVLDDEGAAILVRELADRGISCMPGITASKLLGDGDAIGCALLTNGEELACDVVVAAVGVRPNAALLSEAGADVERGAVCDSTMRTTLSDVYAAGDITQTIDTLDGSKRPLALWPNAVIQGKVAGANMAAADQAPVFEGNFALNAVDFFDISLLTSGVINPDPEGGYQTRIISDGSAYAKFVTKGDRLFGYILLNRPDNAGIYTAVIDQCIPLSTLAEDFFDQAPTNLDFPQSVRWSRLHRCYPADLDQRGWKEGGE